MNSTTSDISPPRTAWFLLVWGILVVFTPMVVLMAVAMHVGPSPLLAGGVATQAFLAFGLLHQVGAARAASHKTASPVYLMAVLIIWMASQQSRDLFLQVCMFILVGVPLTLFLAQEFLFVAGGGARRARALVRRLAVKADWPRDLAACKTLPEVKALREALHDDAEPVFVLLMNPKPQVRIAALAALEFRPAWKKGQAETVLQAAKFAVEPPVRSTALMALANVEETHLLSAIANYMRDGSPEVRRATAEALLWNVESRWGAIRKEIHDAFADPRCQEDGSLPITSALPDLAKVDLTIWAGEPGSVGNRAIRTLLNHFRREVDQNLTGQLVEDLGRSIADSKIPSPLRVEYARLLVEKNVASATLWNRLLEGNQPSYIRLLAAGALLREGSHDAAMETLKEVARVPNREMVLQVATIVQKSLRIDMGLPLGGDLPDPQSKLAAEVARRVLDWSSGNFKPLLEERSSRRTRLDAVSRQRPRSSGDQSLLN